MDHPSLPHRPKPTSNPQSPSLSPPKPSPLLSLPPELRLQIHTQILHSHPVHNPSTGRGTVLYPPIRTLTSHPSSRRTHLQHLNTRPCLSPSPSFPFLCSAPAFSGLCPSADRCIQHECYRRVKKRYGNGEMETSYTYPEFVENGNKAFAFIPPMALVCKQFYYEIRDVVFRSRSRSANKSQSQSEGGNGSEKKGAPIRASAMGIEMDAAPGFLFTLGHPSAQFDGAWITHLTLSPASRPTARHGFELQESVQALCVVAGRMEEHREREREMGTGTEMGMKWGLPNLESLALQVMIQAYKLWTPASKEFCVRDGGEVRKRMRKPGFYDPVGRFRELWFVKNVVAAFGRRAVIVVEVWAVGKRGTRDCWSKEGDEILRVRGVVPRGVGLADEERVDVQAWRDAVVEVDREAGWRDFWTDRGMGCGRMDGFGARKDGRVR